MEEREYDVENLEAKLQSLLTMKDRELMMESNGKNRAENVQYLGKISMKYELNGHIFDQEKDVYVVRENLNGKVVSRVYTSDMEVLGVMDIERGEFIPNERNMDNIEMKEKLEELNNGEDVIDLEKMQEEKLEEVAKTLGVDKEKIKRIDEIDLNQKVNSEEDIAESVEEEAAEAETEDGDERKQINEEETQKIEASVKQEINLNTKVNDVKTLGSKLNLSQEYEKLLVVESDDLDIGNNNTRYRFIAKRKDGTSEIIDDRLEYDARTGSSGMEESIKIDADGTARKDNSTISRYKISGTDEFLSIENGQYGNIGVHYGQRSHDGDVPVETQLETSNTMRVDKEIRDIQGEYKGEHNTDNIKDEADVHFERHGEEVLENIEQFNGNEEIIVEEGLIQSEVNRLMENSEIERAFTKNEVEGMIRNKIKVNGTYSIDEIRQILEQTEKEIEQDASRIHTMDAR